MPVPAKVSGNAAADAFSMLYLHTFDEQVQMNPATEVNDHPKATVKLFKSAEHLGAAFAIRFFYSYLYHLLRRKHERRDHLLLPIDGSDDEPCDCKCVLDRSVDLFLQQCHAPSCALENQNAHKSNKRYVLFWDAAFTACSAQSFYKEMRQESQIVKLRNSHLCGTNGVEFLMNGYKKIIPVYYHKELQSVFVAEFSTPSAVMGDTMLSIANQVDRTFHSNNLCDIREEFTKTLRLLLHEEKEYVNTDFVRLVTLKTSDDESSFSMAEELKQTLGNKLDKDNEQYKLSTSIQLDLESFVAANVLNLLHGLLHPLTQNIDFLEKVNKYYIVFPKSGVVNPSLNILIREASKDVFIRMKRTGSERRQFQLHAYRDKRTNRIFHMEFPPFLSFCQLLEGKECAVPVNSPAMKKVTGSLREQVQALSEETSLSWLMCERLSAFCDEFKDNLLENPDCRFPFRTEFFKIIKWNDELNPSILAERDLLVQLNAKSRT